MGGRSSSCLGVLHDILGVVPHTLQIGGGVEGGGEIGVGLFPQVLIGELDQVFLVVSYLMAGFGGGLSMGTLLQGAFPGAPQTQLAMFHTVFNVITVFLVLRK